MLGVGVGVEITPEPEEETYVGANTVVCAVAGGTGY